jgi:hypothetical protein
MRPCGNNLVAALARAEPKGFERIALCAPHDIGDAELYSAQRFQCGIRCLH